MFCNYVSTPEDRRHVFIFISEEINIFLKTFGNIQLYQQIWIATVKGSI